MQKISAILLTVTFSLTIIFHIIVLMGIIPYGMVWGGRIKNTQDLYVFEAISIWLNALFLLIVLVKGNFVKIAFSPRLINILLWFMCIIFTLNTVGNLFAIDPLEKYIFTPITLMIAVLSFFLSVSKSNKVVAK